MKKRISAIIICLLMIITFLPGNVLAGVGESGGGTTYVDEHYKGFNYAVQIALNQKVTVNVPNFDEDGNLNSYAFDNCFKIVLPQAGYIYGTFDDSDHGLTIYNEQNEEEIAKLGEWKLGLDKGTYFVTGNFTFNEAGSFTINYIDTNIWEKELNNDLERATLLPQATTFHGWIEEWGDDRYELTIPEPGLVSFSLTFNNEKNPDAYWWVDFGDDINNDGTFFNDDLQLLAGEGMHGAEDSDDEKTIRVDDVGLSAGTYYLLVGNSGADDRNYRIRWDYTPSDSCETERNDTFETAQEIPVNQSILAESTYVQPMYSRRDDEDHFKFTLTEPGVISLSVTPEEEPEEGTEFTCSFEVLDAEENWIESYEMPWKAGEEQTTPKLGLSAGTYHINNPNVPANCHYHFTVNYEVDSFWEKERNDEYDQATAIAAGSTMNGWFEWDDIYRFTLSQPGYINAAVAYQYHEDELNQERQWALSLDDAQGENLITVSGSTEAEAETKTGFAIRKYGLPAGTYYLRVWANWVDQKADQYYSLSLDFVPTNYFETECNDNQEIADPVELNQDYGGNYTNDADWFRFVIPKDGKVTLNAALAKAGDLSFSLKNQEDDDIWSDTLAFSQGDQTLSTEEIELKAGTYYLRAWGDDWIPYTFRINYGEGTNPNTPTYTVTFLNGYQDEEAGMLKTETVEEGKAATAPKDPQREGYTFKGWDKTFSNITADTTVTATWEKTETPPVIPATILSLPETLGVIDSEAFVGTAADAVRIPSTVERIADDAFDDGVVIIATEESYAYDWASEHGFAVIVE